MIYRTLFILCGVLTLLHTINNVHAQTITILQPMDWGEFIDFQTTVTRIIIDEDTGVLSGDVNEVIFIRQPSRAEVFVSGGPPNSTFEVDFDGVRVEIFAASGNERWRINRWRTSPDSPTTDGAGNASFFIGSQMISRRNFNVNRVYSDNTFTGVMNITLVF